MTNWIIKVFRKDRRRKTGEWLFERRQFDNMSEQDIKKEAANLVVGYPTTQFRIEYHPATKIVKNLMSGKDVEIPYETPRCCDPSSELYWSM